MEKYCILCSVFKGMEHILYLCFILLQSYDERMDACVCSWVQKLACMFQCPRLEVRSCFTGSFSVGINHTHYS